MCCSSWSRGGTSSNLQGFMFNSRGVHNPWMEKGDVRTCSVMILVYDTETTGLPRDWNAPLTDSENWPRLVQLAWQLHTPDGKLVSRGNRIVRPDGFTIPYNAAKVHGITTGGPAGWIAADRRHGRVWARPRSGGPRDGPQHRVRRQHRRRRVDSLGRPAGVTDKALIDSRMRRRSSVRFLVAVAANSSGRP